MSGDVNLIGPDETAFRLELTPAQLRVTHTALKILFDDLGRRDRDVRRIAREVLDKLPAEHELRGVDLGRPVGAPRSTRVEP